MSPYETLGFAMGKSYAYGCLYTILEKQDLAKPKFALVIEAADGLGLKSPRIPASRDEAFDLMLDEYFPRQIEDRFGATPRASYDLAVLVVNTWFGTTIGAESRPGADKIRRYLVSAKVPQAVWDDALTRIARGGNEDDVNHLEKVLDEYYRRR